jgi:hypothetical protein
MNMKKQFLLAISAFLFSSSVVLAQTPRQQTQFPFTINGQECNTKDECRVLCDDPVNAAACAQLNPEATPAIDHFSDPSFVQAAQDALGCSSAIACKAVCSLPANYEKCSEFARQQNLKGGYDQRVLALDKTDASGLTDEQVTQLQQIKEELAGSDQTLKEYCDQEEHQAVCTFLARKFGLKGGQKLDGPGGCESTETCRLYCNDPSHFDECKSFEIPGLNGCSSQLSCYNELQANAANLTDILPITARGGESVGASNSADPQELAQACSGLSQGYQGRSVSEFASDVSRSDACAVLPKSGVPGKNSNCDAYLQSNQPFDQTIFDKICQVSASVPTEGLSPVDTQTAASDLNSYSQWCSQLSVGSQTDEQAGSDWEVIPALCQNFVSTFQQTRNDCQKSESERPTYLQDPVEYTRYCLSAPLDNADYVHACQTDPTNCQSGGFDWYCAQSEDKCQPLYQGRPLDKSVETFASAGLIKDGNEVSLVLDENTQDFAQKVLRDVVAKSGNTANFQVLSQLPENFSPTAQFVSGTGTDQGDGRVNRPVLRPVNVVERLIKSIVSPGSSDQQATPGAPKTFTETNDFATPWYVINARVSDDARPAVTTNPQAPSSFPTGAWGVVRSNELKLKEEFVRSQTEGEAQTRNFTLPNTPVIQVNPDVFRAQERIPSGVQIPTQLRSPEREPTTRPVENKTSTNPDGSTSTSGSTSLTEPTRAPEPTRLPEPTKTETSSETTSGSTTTTTSITRSTTTSSPEVKGAETTASVWDVLSQTATNFLNLLK